MKHTLDEQIIREYLLDNPNFFNHFPELLKTMRLPHSERGTVSLVERQQEILRNRVEQLEEEITSLMTIAKRNERIFKLNNEVAFTLLKCETEHELQAVLSERLRNYFNFSHVRLIDANDSSFTSIWNKRLVLGHYFGRLPIMESKKLFSSEVGSVALTKLSGECGRIIFAIASTDAMHFNPEMDNTLLDQLRQLLDHLLPKLKGSNK